MDVPQIISGRFRIEGEIGTGGMGTVYRATHLGLDRTVAVKIIKSEFAGDREVAERFLREARTMARLRHPHAAMIFDAGDLPDGRHFIIMEFVEGETLAEAIAREGRFSAERAVKIATEVCDVLEEAHRLGIIHRDLKPSNIMLSERGVCVLDFGVAKVLVPSADSSATHVSTGSGQLVGTPRYMSPEQCLGQRVGARSDLYSLGVLLYEMLAGHPPFIDPLQSALLVKQATAPAPALSRLRPDIARPLAGTIHALLAKRPEDRPRTAAMARRQLERSLVQPDRTLPDIEPLSTTVAGVSPAHSIIFRVGAPLCLVVMFGALLAWGYTGESASVSRPDRLPIDVLRSSSPAQMAPVAFRDELPVRAPEPPPINRPPTADRLSFEQARRITAGFSRGSIGSVQIVDTDAGAAIVAIEKPKDGTNFLLVEKHNGKYRVARRSSLDFKGWERASWTSEIVDADEDGYPEIMFSGKESRESRKRQLVLFVPNDRRTYSMLMTGETTANGTPRIIWLSNAAGADAAAYRTALRQKARQIVGKIR